MGGSRVWLFRGLVIVVAGLLLLSWFMPWWRALIYALDGRVEIHPWGLTHNLRGTDAGFMAGTEMPAFFAPFMWTYLVVCLLALLLGLFVKEKALGLGKFRLSLPQVLIGGVGLSYIVVVLVAVIYAAIRLRNFYGTPLIGTAFVALEASGDVGTGVESALLFGYWLACGVGPLCIALALLRDKIIGKPTLKA